MPYKEKVPTKKVYIGCVFEKTQRCSIESITLLTKHVMQLKRFSVVSLNRQKKDGIVDMVSTLALIESFYSDNVDMFMGIDLFIVDISSFLIETIMELGGIVCILKKPVILLKKKNVPLPNEINFYLKESKDIFILEYNKTASDMFHLLDIRLNSV